MKEGDFAMNMEQRFFVGLCDSCNEIYEARAKNDDLKGVTFKCRKDFCSGKVSLDETRSESIKYLKNSTSLKHSRRTC